MDRNYVRVPKNLTDFTPKFMFGLTLRQLLCVLGALGVGLPAYYVTYQMSGNNDMAVNVVLFVVVPFAAFAIFRKNGLPLEKFILIFLRSKVLGKPKRIYQTENFYYLLSQELNMPTEFEEERGHGVLEVSAMEKAKKFFRK